MPKFVIPEKIDQFNIYKDGNKLVGISDEVTLPTVTEITSTIAGPGILGEIESPTHGKFQSMEQVIPFRTLYHGAMEMLASLTSLHLTLRGATQVVSGEGDVSFQQLRIVFVGRKKEFSMGTAKQGDGTGSSVKLELTYLLIEIGGVKCLEIDKLNEIYKVYGVDQLAVIKAMC